MKKGLAILLLSFAFIGLGCDKNSNNNQAPVYATSPDGYNCVYNQTAGAYNPYSPRDYRFVHPQNFNCNNINTLVNNPYYGYRPYTYGYNNWSYYINSGCPIGSYPAYINYGVVCVNTNYATLGINPYATTTFNQPCNVITDQHICNCQSLNYFSGYSSPAGICVN